LITGLHHWGSCWSQSTERGLFQESNSSKNRDCQTSSQWVHWTIC
jgi:hypothetical protein